MKSANVIKCIEAVIESQMHTFEKIDVLKELYERLSLEQFSEDRARAQQNGGENR